MHKGFQTYLITEWMITQGTKVILSSHMSICYYFVYKLLVSTILKFWLISIKTGFNVYKLFVNVYMKLSVN